MAQWELISVFTLALFWGLARGTTVCVSICVPGLLPYLADKPRSAKEGAVFGAVLCLPRLVIFAIIGLAWGAISYTIFRSEAFESTAVWMNVLGYMVLGAIIMVLGSGLFLKAAREKEDIRQEKLAKAGVSRGDPDTTPKPVPETECLEPKKPGRHRLASTVSSALLRFVPKTNRSERTFLLIWGSILGFACLLEVSILEIGVLGPAAASQANATLVAAGLGALVMTLFAVGASIPIIIASASFAAYVDRVKTRERLVSIRVTGSLVMVMIGFLLFLRYALVALSL
jgi:hypothetical protein